MVINVIEQSWVCIKKEAMISFCYTLHNTRNLEFFFVVECCIFNSGVYDAGCLLSSRNVIV